MAESRIFIFPSSQKVMPTLEMLRNAEDTVYLKDEESLFVEPPTRPNRLQAENSEPMDSDYESFTKVWTGDTCEPPVRLGEVIDNLGCLTLRPQICRTNLFEFRDEAANTLATINLTESGDIRVVVADRTGVEHEYTLPGSEGLAKVYREIYPMTVSPEGFDASPLGNALSP